MASKWKICVSTLAAGGIFAASAAAATIVNQTYSGSFPATLSGTLPNQGSALEESFTVPSLSNLTAFTTSYASGGFEPNLMLYDSSGHFVTTGVTPGSSPVAQPDPATHDAFDAFLSAPTLPPGSYTLTLTDFLLGQDLTATNLSAGFNLNFGSGSAFVDEMGNARTGNYALRIQLTPASAPEPATIWLAAPLVFLLGFRARTLRA